MLTLEYTCFCISCNIQGIITHQAVASKVVRRCELWYVECGAITGMNFKLPQLSPTPYNCMGNTHTHTCGSFTFILPSQRPLLAVSNPIVDAI